MNALSGEYGFIAAPRQGAAQDVLNRARGIQDFAVKWRTKDRDQPLED
jgi:hypothetical protein